jgi:hypothetical protein
MWQESEIVVGVAGNHEQIRGRLFRLGHETRRHVPAGVHLGDGDVALRKFS